MRTRSLLRVALLLGALLASSALSASVAYAAQSIEQRVRTSEHYRDLPEAQRETAAAMFGQIEREQQPARAFRSLLRELMAADLRLTEALRREARNSSLEANTQATIQHVLDQPIGQIDAKIAAILNQTEHWEKQFGSRPSMSTLSDQALLEALSGWSDGFEHLTRLYDLREQFLRANANELSTLERSPGTNHWWYLLIRRQSIAARVWRARQDIQTLRMVHQIQSDLLWKGLGKEQLRDELHTANRWLVDLSTASYRSTHQSAALKATIRELVEERRDWLSNILAGMETGQTGTRSPLFAPIPSNASSQAVVSWERMRGLFSQSLGNRHRTALALLPILQMRNRVLADLLETTANKSTLIALDLMTSLIETEGQVIAALEKLERMMDRNPVDQGIALDNLLLLENQIQLTIRPFVKAQLEVAKTSESSKRPALMRELTLLLQEEKTGLDELARSAVEEQALWRDYETNLLQLQQERRLFWAHVARNLKQMSASESDALSNALNSLSDERLKSAGSDLERYRRMLDDSARDPVMAFLYGQNKQLPWQSHAQDGDFVQQILRELSQAPALLASLRTAANRSMPDSERGIALAQLARNLALPWVMATNNQGGLNLLIRIAGTEYRISDINSRTPSLGPNQPNQFGTGRPILYASLSPIRFLLAAEGNSQPSLGSNVWNGISNQSYKNRVSHAIIIGGGLTAAGIAALIPGAGWVVSAAILKATVVSESIQLWQDINFGAAKGYADTKFSPERRAEALRNLDAGETGVNVALAVYGLGKGAQGLRNASAANPDKLRTAEQALAAAQENIQEAVETGQRWNRNYEALQDAARSKGDWATWLDYTKDMIGADRTAGELVSASTKAAQAAQQNVDAIQKASQTALTASGHAGQATLDTVRSIRGDAAGEFVGAASSSAGPVQQAVDALNPDTDKDGVPDSRDGCPDDPAKQAPGICGCKFADTDTDHDGVPDCADKCKDDATKSAPGLCGCGTPDTDRDGDGAADCNEDCDDDPNKYEPGVCGCGTPDTDRDKDGIPDCNDRCPDDPSKVEPGICECGTLDTDRDGDGTADCNDRCPDDPNKTEPGQCGCAFPDTDNNGNGIPDCKETEATTQPCPEGTALARDGSCIDMVDSNTAIQMHGTIENQRSQTASTPSTAIYGPRPGHIGAEEMHAGMQNAAAIGWDGSGSRGDGWGPGSNPGTPPTTKPPPGTDDGSSSGGMATPPTSGTGTSTGAGSQQKAWYGIEVIYSYNMSGTPCTNTTHKEGVMTQSEAKALASKEASSTASLLRSVGRTDIKLIRSGIYAGPSASQPTYTGKSGSQCNSTSGGIRCTSNAQCWNSTGSSGYFCKRSGSGGVCVKCPPGYHGKKDGTPECHKD